MLEGQLQKPGSPHADLRKALIAFLQAEKGCSAPSDVVQLCCEPPAVHRGVQTALEAASCVLRTSTESTVLSKAA